MKMDGRSGGIAPYILKLGIKYKAGERALSTHRIGGWVISRASVDSEKRKISFLCRESNSGRHAISVWDNL
jgi:hypothetical protein